MSAKAVLPMLAAPRTASRHSAALIMASIPGIGVCETIVARRWRGTMRIIDLSRELYHRTPSYPGQPPIIHGVWKTHEEAFADSGNVQGNSVMYFSMPDHGGTHIDAPRHFGKTGMPIDEYPLENCIVPGICIDLRDI